MVFVSDCCTCLSCVYGALGCSESFSLSTMVSKEVFHFLLVDWGMEAS